MSLAERERLLQELKEKYPGVSKPFPAWTRDQRRAAHQEAAAAVSENQMSDRDPSPRESPAR
jgi:hypothetical protein